MILANLVFQDQIPFIGLFPVYREDMKPNWPDFNSFRLTKRFLNISSGANAVNISELLPRLGV